jgi:hypothetical protein
MTNQIIVFNSHIWIMDKERNNISFIYWTAVEPSPLLARQFIGLLYQPLMTDDDCGAIGGMNDMQGKPKY